MGWHGPRGSCGCCGPGVICANCSALTYFTISGLVSASCASGCDAKNGTYVFRTAGSYFEGLTSCGWTGSWSFDNCGLDDADVISVGVIGSSCGSSNAWGIAFESDGMGGIVIKVVIDLQYARNAFTPTFGDRTGYTVEWRGTFTDCASAVGATLSHYATTINNCLGTPIGDLCAVAGATITLG